MRLAAFTLAGLAVLVVLWARSASAIRDVGGYRETWRTFLGELAHGGHARYHIIGAALTLWVGAAFAFAGDATFDGDILVAVSLITWGLWYLVELAQRYPRKPYPNRRRGRFSGFDLVANAMGVAIAALLTWGAALAMAAR